jgi:hypothetical protein
MTPCALCMHLEVPPRPATGTVGLLTALPDLIDRAVERFAELADGTHVVVNACPEHVVDVYRGRIPGVRMAWRLAEPTGTEGPSGRLQSPARASSSRV